MNILVCLKQVPNTKHMTVDPKTHRLVRHGVSAMLNPADRLVLERALRMREEYGGTLTAISMGAPQAADVLLSAWMVGADHGFLLTDPAFAGSDTFATASVLAAGVRYLENESGTRFDAILCGKSTIDGETGQVGPELAELLGIPHFSNLSRLERCGSGFRLEYTLNDTKILAEAVGPILLTYPLSGEVYLRAAIGERLDRLAEQQIPQLTLEELSPWLCSDELGLHGSATRVIRSFIPQTQRACIRFTNGSPREKVAALLLRLQEDGVLTRQGQRVPPPRTRRSAGSGRICVYVEQTAAGRCRSLGLELLSAAATIADDARLRIAAILIGSDNSKAADELKEYGVDEIFSCEDAVFDDMQVHDYVEAMSRIVEQYRPEGLLVGATEMGKELAARVAARFHTGLTADCTGVRYDSELQSIVWSRPAYDGKLMADIVCARKRPQMGTIREGVFEKPAPCPGAPSLVSVPLRRSALTEKVIVLNRSAAPGFQKTNDGHVSIVVGMGRGIQDMDGLDLCCDFADAIGADIGATNAVVRMQLLSQQYQIGTNGRTIRPDIYIACGISGSLQHLTGVQDAGCIVAINTDPQAEIFKYANYGIVGNLFEIIPELERQLKAIL